MLAGIPDILEVLAVEGIHVWICKQQTLARTTVPKRLGVNRVRQCVSLVTALQDLCLAPVEPLQ